MRQLHQVIDATIGFNRWLILALEDGRIEKWQDDPEEYSLISFGQSWASTALGFGGIGGQAITSAQTTIFSDYSHAIVFIGGRFAYHIQNPNEDFWKDVANQGIKKVSQASQYEKSTTQGKIQK